MQTVSKHQIERLASDKLSFSEEHNRMLLVGVRVRWFNDRSVCGVIKDIRPNLVYGDTIYDVDWGNNPPTNGLVIWGGACFGARLMPRHDVFAVWNGK